MCTLVVISHILQLNKSKHKFIKKHENAKNSYFTMRLPWLRAMPESITKVVKNTSFILKQLIRSSPVSLTVSNDCEHYTALNIFVDYGTMHSISN